MTVAKNPVAKPRKPRTPKTTEQKAADLAKAKAKVAALENTLYADQLAKAIADSKIVEAYQQIKAAVKEAGDVLVLSAIAKAASIKKVIIDHAETKPRKPRKPKAPK